MALELPRSLRLGSRGRDVKALHRALRTAGVRPRAAKSTNVFDEETDAEVRSFQAAQRIEVDGEVGRITLARLEPHFDAYGRFLIGQVAKRIGRASNVRQRIVAAANVGYEHREAVHYTQSVQRMEGVRERIRPPRYPRREDCSSFATWCYWAASAPDPNGLGYNGFGYTGTQIQCGAVTREPRPGDLVFYGRGSIPSHVAVYVGNGRVISHGSEAGPYLLALDYRRDRHHVRTYL